MFNYNYNKHYMEVDYWNNTYLKCFLFKSKLDVIMF